jgi:hypothetical protein
MSQEPSPDNRLAKASSAGAESDTIKDGEVESILEKVPPHLIRDTLVAIIREGTGPKYDADSGRAAHRAPRTAIVLIASATSSHDRSIKYFSSPGNRR